MPSRGRTWNRDGLERRRCLVLPPFDTNSPQPHSSAARYASILLGAFSRRLIVDSPREHHPTHRWIQARCLRAEEPWRRIPDHVTPLVKQGLACPVAARTGDRNRCYVASIRHVTRNHGVSRVCRARNRAAYDGTGREAADDAKSEAAAATLCPRITRIGDRGECEHTCRSDSDHSCFHVDTPSDASARPKARGPMIRQHGRFARSNQTNPVNLSEI
jgi:hypothetical protein